MKELKNMSSLCSPWAIKKLGLDRNHTKRLCTLYSTINRFMYYFFSRYYTSWY